MHTYPCLSVVLHLHTSFVAFSNDEKKSRRQIIATQNITAEEKLLKMLPNEREIQDFSNSFISRDVSLLIRAY